MLYASWRLTSRYSPPLEDRVPHVRAAPLSIFLNFTLTPNVHPNAHPRTRKGCIRVPPSASSSNGVQRSGR